MPNTSQLVKEDESSTNSILKTESSVEKHLDVIPEVVTPVKIHLNISALGMISSHHSLENNSLESPNK